MHCNAYPLSCEFFISKSRSRVHLNVTSLVMSEKAAMTPSIKTSNLSKPEKVACPKCDASLMFYRSDKPHIDQCGFESYSLKCRACGSMLVGIIDPADSTALLLTVCS